jgi:hypothetical protein
MTEAVDTNKLATLQSPHGALEQNKLWQCPENVEKSMADEKGHVYSHVESVPCCCSAVWKFVPEPTIPELPHAVVLVLPSIYQLQ